MENKKNALKNREGFSMIELIIVIAIMGILVGIVGTQVVPYMEKAKEAKDQQILSSVATAAVSAMTLTGESSGRIIYSCPIQSLHNVNGDPKPADIEFADQLMELLLPEGEEKTGENLQTYLASKFTSKKAKDNPTIFISHYPQIGKLYVFLTEGTVSPIIPTTQDGIMYVESKNELTISDKVFMYVESN